MFVYPTWWSGPPAILKGWLERVHGPRRRVPVRRPREGAARARPTSGASSGSAPTGRRGRTSSCSTTAAGGCSTRALRMNCGLRTPTTWLGLYSIDTLGDAERAAFLDRVEHTMAHLEPAQVDEHARRHLPPRPGVVHRRGRRAGGRRAHAARRRACGSPTSTPRASIPCSPPRNAERHLEPGADPAVAHHADDLQWCQRLVLVYPTWWSGQPAMMKGWIDRVWVRDVALDLPAGVQPGARPAAQRPPARRRSRPTARRSSSTRSRARPASAWSPAPCGRCATRWPARRGSRCTASTPRPTPSARRSSTASSASSALTPSPSEVFGVTGGFRTGRRRIETLG